VAGAAALPAGGGGVPGAAGANAGGGAGAAMAGASSAGAGPTAPLGSLVVSNLKIDPNPKMTLSCYVSWTTSEPAASEVQFGVGGYQLHLVDSTLATDHKVHVVGMHPETAYQIKAVSTSASATGSAEGSFTTGKVPASLPSKASLVTNQPDKMQPGWTLTNYQVGGSSSTSTEPGIIVIVDEQGIPVWYYVHGTSADQFGMTSTDWLPNGHVLVGNASAEPAVEVDLEGNVVWTGPTGGTPAASHHTGKLKNGDYAIVRESNATARVEELSPDDKVVWTWDLYDYIKPKTSANDWCHVNSVSFDEVNDFLYFNCRYQGLFKVKRSDKSIVWQMGAAIDDSHSGDITYLPDNSARFNDSHDPEIHDDGTILFYDNQGWSGHTGGEGNGSYHTRVVEYKLDEPNKTATLTWEFPGNFSVDDWYKTTWYTPIWGDADRLGNGDVLVTAGVHGSGTHTRIFEVTRAGEVVWAIEWPENNGSYRAARIEQPPAQKLVP
jgi:arylsulfate sulfotransferase